MCKDATNLFRQLGVGILGAVVARWTAGQLVERSILHQGHDLLQIPISPGCPRSSIALQVQNSGLKHQSIIHSFIGQLRNKMTGS